MQDYGRLSRRSLDEMIAGARVDVAPYKRGDMDFVLWKPSKENEPGWESPWGRGRPGWHIECSAMSAAHLGETFDIHGGGIDLVFPHHENEIAQSRCAFGRDVMANVWMHNGFLQVEGEKMSKSLGNFVTINELLHTEKFGGRKWPGEVLRLAMLRTHYRQPIDWTVKALEEAELSLRKWGAEIGAIDLGGEGFGSGFGAPDGSGYGGGFAGVDTVLDALADDLNTPFALTVLHAIGNGRELDLALKLLGIDIQSYAQWVERERVGSVNEGVVSSRIAARNAARAVKNWAESDRIRDELAAMGIALYDNKDGTTTWEVKR
jgi:cysteinyl-tRNA synthetase